MNIKSDVLESRQKPKKIGPSGTQLIFWSLILVISVGLMAASIFAPQITGFGAIIVFFIGLNRLDASIEFFKKAHKYG